MKRKFLVFAAVLLVVVGALYFFVPRKIANMITEYPPVTFEDVLPYDSMRIDYGIGENSAPEDYGYNEVKEFSIFSLKDSVALNAWYVPAPTKTNKTIAVIHGRTSNRLKTMKYLELFKETGIDSSYNILIPDMRNSGKSDPASTFMGYKFAEDLASYMKYLHQKRKQDTVLLYSFSMGAIATMIMVNRADLQEAIADIYIEKVILDSPLSNVKNTLKWNADEMGLPDVVFNEGFDRFNSMVDNYAENMKLSYLIHKLDVPMLILQGKADEITPASILDVELKQINKANLQVFYFDRGAHVRAYQIPEYKKRYTMLISGFVLEE